MTEHGGVRVFVGVHGSVGSLQALRYAVAEARTRHAALYSVIAWTPPGGEALDRRTPQPHLRRAWQAAAMTTLRTAWNEALGGIPDDLPVALRAERGKPAWALCQLADRDDDLIVVGSGRGRRVWRAARPSVGRYCVARAGCAVVVVPLPALARQLGRGALPRSRRSLDDVFRQR